MLDRNSKEKQDIVLAKFIIFMQKVFQNHRINYFRNIQIKSNWEEELNENVLYFDKIDNFNEFDLKILNEKEKYLFELHYKCGLSYPEIAKITNEKVSTLKQRRNRAVSKLKFRMGE